MRNKYPGPCYRCGTTVSAGDGHFERFGSGWRVQHAGCAITHRGEADPARKAMVVRRAMDLAQTTGKKASRARKLLREEGIIG